MSEEQPNRKGSSGNDFATLMIMVAASFVVAWGLMKIWQLISQFWT